MWLERWDNHIVSECIRLAQKHYKSKNNWVGQVIHKELRNRLRLKFDHANIKMKRMKLNVISRYKRIS